MFVDLGIDDLLEKLKNPRLAYYDYLPGASVAEALACPEDHFEFWINRPNIPLTNLYQFMQGIGLEPLYESVAEMVANASHHGNKYSLHSAPNGDPMKSLSVKVFTADNGVLFRVRNEGTGFDYRQMLDQFQNRSVHSESVLGGAGTRILAHPRLMVSYEDYGRATNLLCLLN